jgi:activator of HSP90 ATPase
VICALARHNQYLGREIDIAINQSVIIKSSPENVYNALTSAEEFSEVTRAPAEIAQDAGGAFSCFDGQIVGRHIELIPNQ